MRLSRHLKRLLSSAKFKFRYVEILEQQQSQLVQGLQHMYQLLRNGEQWPGEPLTNQSNGSPLTHDILARLGLLQPKEDDSHEHENFEEDPVQTERRLIEAGAPRVKRRASFSSDSEHDHDHQQISPVSDTSPHSTTPTSASARQPTFSHPFPRQPIQLTPSSNQSPASVAPQLSTPFQSSPQQISSVPPAALHPSTLQEPWVSSELNMGNSFEDSINSMDLDQYPSYDFSGINFDSTMASTTQGMSGFGPTAPLFIDDFVNDPSQLELTPYLSQTVS